MQWKRCCAAVCLLDGVNGTFAHCSLPWCLFNVLAIVSKQIALEGGDATKCSKGISPWMLWLLLCAGQKRQETKIPSPRAMSMPLAPFMHHMECKSNRESALCHCSLLAASDLKQQTGSQRPTPLCRSHPVPSLFVGKHRDNKGRC